MVARTAEDSVGRRVEACACSVTDASAQELILYLLQLVQGIKFDSLALLSASMREEWEGGR